MDLSIIIVNYNTKQLTLNCLKFVYESITDYRYEVILIDKDSNDDSIEVIREAYPQAHLIVYTESTGFSKTNNQGMKISQGRYILLLNSDTIAEPNTFNIMLQSMDTHPEIGASDTKVVLPDGTLDKACKRGGFPTTSATFYYVS